MVSRAGQKLIALIICLVAGFGVIALLCLNSVPSSPQQTASIPDTPYFLDLPESTTSGNLVYLEEELKKVIEPEIKEGVLTDVGVYFLDLNNGEVVSYHAEDSFIPASLLKLPIMISYFKDAEMDNSLLDKKLVYTPHDMGAFNQKEIPEHLRPKEGESYTILDFITRMITLSDNRSAALLFENVNQNTMSHVFTDLNIPLPNSTAEQLNVTPRNYSSFFYVLYKKNYITAELSDLALDILKKVTYKGGLNKGLPPEIEVAHKFGERDYEHSYEFHDCGIIYYPEHPYLLCVMTLGKNLEEQQKIIGTTSAFFYNYYRSQAPKI